MDFERVDMREMTPEELLKANEMAEIVFKINHTMPNTEEYSNLLNELFGDNLGENSVVMAPFAGAAFDRISIGNNVYVNSNSLFMASQPMSSFFRITMMNMTGRFFYASRFTLKREHGLEPVPAFCRG